MISPLGLLISVILSKTFNRALVLSLVFGLVAILINILSTYMERGHRFWTMLYVTACAFTVMLALTHVEYPL